MPLQQLFIAVPKPSKRAAVKAFVRERGWEKIGRAEWLELRAAFPETSKSVVRTALAELAMPADQPFAGVVTKTLEDLEASLVAMSKAYASDVLCARECRTEVITAKDRARFAALNPKTDPEKRAIKEEMVDWMLVWLGDPALFPAWVRLRKRELTAVLLLPPESSRLL